MKKRHLNLQTKDVVPETLRFTSRPERDYDYQDSESYEPPYRNPQRGYAPIDSDRAPSDLVRKVKQESKIRLNVSKVTRRIK